ncbi:hypothetical protein BH24ACI5_BH24ACI5_16040 [soil metagenome]
MPDRKPFLLRIDRNTLDAVQRWADDDLRSLNGQIEFLLRRVLREAGREIRGAEDGGDERKSAQKSRPGRGGVNPKLETE